MHRSFLVTLAVAMLFGCVGQSMAADGNLSKSMLTDMGLSGVQVMSDVQGEEIRGKGWAASCGFSIASAYECATSTSFGTYGTNVSGQGTSAIMKYRGYGKYGRYGKYGGYHKNRYSFGRSRYAAAAGGNSRGTSR